MHRNRNLSHIVLLSVVPDFLDMLYIKPYLVCIVNCLTFGVCQMGNCVALAEFTAELMLIQTVQLYVHKIMHSAD